jgi:hypothetical protein
MTTYKGNVAGVGGGVIEVMVDRSTQRYPIVGQDVIIQEGNELCCNMPGQHWTPGDAEWIHEAIQAARDIRDMPTGGLNRVAAADAFVRQFVAHWDDDREPMRDPVACIHCGNPVDLNSDREPGAIVLGHYVHIACDVDADEQESSEVSSTRQAMNDLTEQLTDERREIEVLRASVAFLEAQLGHKVGALELRMQSVERHVAGNGSPRRAF